MMRARMAAIAVVAAVTSLLTAVPAPAIPPDSITDTQGQYVWDVAAQRLSDLASPTTRYPFGATGTSPYQRTTAYSWTSGFFPASLWMMYERTGDPSWLARARSFTKGLLPVARWTGSHDLGFMVGLPTRLGMTLDPSAMRRATYRKALITAARSLSTRWSGRIRAIRSGDYDGRWGLIIDSAMNAPLLIEAGGMIGGTQGARLTSRGLQHMRTLTARMVRTDGSTIHRMSFDTRTGLPIAVIPGQGLSPTSTWSRGQAWAIHGFATAYDLTGDASMLDTARRTADYWMSQVPAGVVPAWDLDVTDASAPRDSSAAAIAAAGLLALADAEPDAARSATDRAYALALLGTLAGPPWVTQDAGGRGVLQRQAYNVPADPREGTYVWGDTYLLAALRASAAD